MRKREYHIPTKLPDGDGGFYPVGDFIDLLGKNEILDDENRKQRDEIKQLTDKLRGAEDKQRKLNWKLEKYLTIGANALTSAVIAMLIAKKKK